MEKTLESAFYMIKQILATITGKLYPTQADLDKLSGIEAGAEVNNISDANALALTSLGDTNLHTHDGRYATEIELSNALALKANLASPTFTGNPVLPATTVIGAVSATELQYLNGATSNIQDQINAIGGGGVTLQQVYPVGSIYMNVGYTSPATLFGFGTWVALQSRFLIGVGTGYNEGATGGEATHILTDAEMPVHTHIQNSHNHTQNAHIHQVPRTQAGYAGTTRYNPTDLNSTTTYPTDPTTATNIATTAVNQNAGGDSAHNNLPPYLAVYMWKRTA